MYHFYNKNNIILDYSKSAAMHFFLGTQKRVRNSRGKRAISDRATNREQKSKKKIDK